MSFRFSFLFLELNYPGVFNFLFLWSSHQIPNSIFRAFSLIQHLIGLAGDRHLDSHFFSQIKERLLCTQEVKGSTPLFSTESVRTQFFDILERWKNIFHNNEQK